MWSHPRHLALPLSIALIVGAGMLGCSDDSAGSESLDADSAPALLDANVGFPDTTGSVSDAGTIADSEIDPDLDSQDDEDATASATDAAADRDTVGDLHAVGDGADETGEPPTDAREAFDIEDQVLDEGDGDVQDDLAGDTPGSDEDPPDAAEGADDGPADSGADGGEDLDQPDGPDTGEDAAPGDPGLSEPDTTEDSAPADLGSPEPDTDTGSPADGGPCPEGEDEDGDGVCDAEDECPKYDDTVDINDNGVKDCVENPLRNHAFDEGIELWGASSDHEELEWADDENAPPARESGAIRVRSLAPPINFFVGPYQCVRVDDTSTYDLFVQALYPTGQERPPGNGVSLWVTWYDHFPCEFPNLGVDFTETDLTEGEWVLLELNDLTPPTGANHARVRLTLLAYEGVTHEALFDNAFMLVDGSGE